MRHRKGKNHLGRTSSHYRATMSNMMISLIEHGRLRTTEAKAKELRRVAERTVTKATRLGDILVKDWGKLEADDKARLVHALRIVRRTVRDRTATLRLFSEWAPRYLGRPGGYTSVYKLNRRNGDNAPMAMLQFVEAEAPAKEGTEAPAKG